MNNGNNKKVDQSFIKSFYRIIKKRMFSGVYEDLKNKPTSMKNPHKLKFTGAVSAVYDGSEEKEITIPLPADDSGKVIIPESLKNPFKLKFTGSTNDEYDGSEEKTINIPSQYTHPTSANGGAKASGFYKITTDANGHISTVTPVTKTDITNLGIPAQDTVYTHPSSSGGGSKASGLYKITTDANGHVTAATAVTKTDITNLGIPGQDTTYNVATTSVNGLLSSGDKTKLNKFTEINHRTLSVDPSYEIMGMEEPSVKELISDGANNGISQVINVVGKLFDKLKDEYLQTPNNENPTVSQVLVTNGTDNYFKKASLSYIQQKIRPYGSVNGASSQQQSCFARITFTDYCEYPAVFRILVRGGYAVKIAFCAGFMKTSNPYYFYITKDLQPNTTSNCVKLAVYAVKVDAGVYDFYCTHSYWGSGWIECLSFRACQTLEFKSTLVSSIPTGAISPTVVDYIP